MFFTSGILIAFFCFAFYLIWNQFLKKDTRLSTGLQVLRRKITDLENLSLTVEAQMDRHQSLIKDRTQNMESLLRTAKVLSERLEKNIKTIQALNNKSSSPEENLQTDKNLQSYPPVKESHPVLQSRASSKKQETSSSFRDLNSPACSHLKMVKTQSDKKLQFGKSPFSNIDFVDSP